MVFAYRIVDLRNPDENSEVTVASSKRPEQVASDALDLELVRSGASKDLVAKIYWQITDQPMNVVRLYRKVEESRTRVRKKLLVED